MTQEFRVGKFTPGDYQVVKLSKSDAEALKSGRTLNYLGVKVVNLESKGDKLKEYHGADRLALMRNGVLFLSKERCQQLGARAQQLKPVLHRTGEQLEAGELSEEDATLVALSGHADAQAEGTGETPEAEAEEEISPSAREGLNSKRTQAKLQIFNKGFTKGLVQAMAKANILKLAILEAAFSSERKRLEHAKERDVKEKQKRKAWERQDDLKWDRNKRLQKVEAIRHERKEERIEDRKDYVADLRDERIKSRIKEGQIEQAEDIKER